MALGLGAPRSRRTSGSRRSSSSSLGARKRRRGRLQRAARPARRARPSARPRVHAAHERRTTPCSVSACSPAGRSPTRRRPLDLGRRRGLAGVAAVAALRARAWIRRRPATRSRSRSCRRRRPTPPGSASARVTFATMARRREWTRETLVAGVRAGDRRALARAITPRRERATPLAYELVRELYPRHGQRVRDRRHRPAGRRQVDADRRARPPRARSRSRPSA